MDMITKNLRDLVIFPSKNVMQIYSKAVVQHVTRAIGIVIPFF